MEWTEGDCHADGVRLHYARGGRGSPVLLLHGITDNGRCWGRTAEALAQDYDVVLIDQRGHGCSGAPASGYELPDFARDAAGVLRALGIAPTAVVGHSLGARAALTLAATNPDLVARVVLEDPPLSTQATSWRDNEENRRRLEWLRAQTHDELVALCHAQSPAWDDAECGAWAQSKRQVSPWLWGPGGATLDTDWHDEMRAVTCPTLLVRGDTALGSLIDDDRAAEAMRLLRHGGDARIAAAGHSIHRDKASAFIAAIAPFLLNTTSR